MGRQTTLVLVDGDGSPLGTFGPIASSPWWMEVDELVDAAAGAGLAISVLRLLHGSPHCGAERSDCLYLAELLEPGDARLGPVPEGLDLHDHPARLGYARPGGNRDALAWAQRRLGPGLPARQHRTWNLSCVHRIGDAWLKQVPPFFAHEGAMIELVASRGYPAPPLVDHERTRGWVLVRHVEGPMIRDSDPSRWPHVIAQHVELQRRMASDVDSIVALGAPDWRHAPLLGALTALAARPDVRATLEGFGRDELDRLDECVDALAGRLAELYDCGLPDTLVHGDLHHGNVIDGRGGTVVLDWGDAGAGHALLDVSAMVLGYRDPTAVVACVSEAWRRCLPRSDPARALRLIEPIAALRQALIYRRMLDQIEPSEHPYHADDVPFWLRRAIAVSGPRR